MRLTVVNFGLSLFALLLAASTVVRCEDIVIKKDGFIPETYKVLTPDDYVIRIVRIKSSQSPVKPRGVVFLMHCLLCSCGCYIAAGQNQSLAYNFVRRGYDVWLGNARGTRWTEHRTLSKRDVRFWDYSFNRFSVMKSENVNFMEKNEFKLNRLDEIGAIDIPAMIDFVLKSTRARRLHYVGHSMGGATFVIFMASHPEYASRIKSAYLMAPAMSVGHSGSELLQAIVNSYVLIKGTFDALNYQFFPVDQKLLNALELEIKRQPSLNILLEWVYFNLVGPDSGLTNRKRLIPLIKLLLDVMSVNQLLHFHQFYTSGEFKMYDYLDRDRNIQKYGSPHPPFYNITQLPKTLVTFFGTGDNLVTPENSKRFFSKVKVTRNFYLDRYNHLDFQYSKNLKSTIFNKIIRYVEK